MSPRRILLLIMLVALGACAAGGMLALVATSSETVWELIGTAFSTAVATGLLMPLSLLTDRPKLRAGGLCGMGVVIVCWMTTLVMLWGSSIVGESLVWRAFSVFWQTLLIGIPAAVALLLMNVRATHIAARVFVLIAIIGYAICLLGSVMPWESRAYFGASDASEPWWATGSATVAMGALCCLMLVNLGSGDRRYFRWAGVIICAGALAMIVVAIWRAENDEVMVRVTGVLVAVSIVMAHANLVLMARLKGAQSWIEWGTLACSVAAGASAAAGIQLSDGSDFEASAFFRFSSAGAIAAASGSLGLIVLTMFNRKAAPTDAIISEFKEITLICPSCSTRQLMPLGDGACKVCSLRISVKITEPRCPQCSYLLYRIASDRCPECGATIRHAPETAAPPLAAASPLPEIAAVNIPSQE